MNLYAESSAVLAWLLGEAAAGDVREALGSAERVVASDLTLIESDRVLIRAVVTEQVSQAAAAERRSLLANASARWVLLPLAPEVVDRSRRPFLREPVRTLDAIHLASALLARTGLPEIALLSLDESVRSNGEALGFVILP
ncbi:MAG: type II toxin-antitoxin system VapC family toxin [Gemmatimonadetes bacterium]|nr:type II toxin-antitoxin system VapC family toxin [Gemmatimonadota bacterium]